MKKLLLLSFSFTMLFGSQVNAQTSPPLFGVSPFTDSLWTMDTTSFTVIGAIQLVDTLAAAPVITGVNGMAVQPCTGTFYIVYKNGGTGRLLGTVNTSNGIVTQIGNTGDNVAGISFLDQATLYAQTGDGATASETLFTVNLLTAALTLVDADAAGNDGETMCVNSDDGLIYRWSGLGTQNVDEIMQTYNTGLSTYTLVTMSGFDGGEMFGSTYMGNNTFLMNDINSSFITCTTTGVLTDLGFFAPDDLKGIAFPSRYVWFDQAGGDSLCPSGDTTLLHASSGASAYQWYQDGILIPGAINDTYDALVPGSYKCEITLGACTSFSDDSLNIGSYTVTAANISPVSPSFCQGDSVTITDAAIGASYEWIVGGFVVDTDNSFTATAGGPVEYRIYSANGCFDVVLLNVIEIPLPTVVANADQLSYCDGDMTTLTGSGADSYVWDNGVIDGVAFNQPVGPPVMYHLTGTDTITGCTNLDSILVNVFPNPTASGTSTDEILGTDGTIDGTFTGAPVLTFDWDNDGTGDFDDPEDLTGLTAGTYTVVVMDGNGCTATTTVIVGSQVGLNEFGMDASLSIYPNPNNGVFTVALANMTSENMTLQVINVAGQIVFEADASSNLVDVNISEFGNGTYTLRITDGTHNATEQIIVGH